LCESGRFEFPAAGGQKTFARFSNAAMVERWRLALSPSSAARYDSPDAICPGTPLPAGRPMIRLRSKRMLHSGLSQTSLAEPAAAQSRE